MIKIICVGKLKEKYLKEALNEYCKRLGRFCKLSIIEVPDENIKEKALINESISILKHVKENDFVITLDIDGEMLSSLDFASKLDRIMINNSNIVFIIGGSYGLDDSVKKRSNYSLSFSRMTFPHQLFRIILFEQLYRSFKIINNEVYHK